MNEKTGGLNSVVDSDKVDQVKEGIEDNKVGERNPSERKDVDLKGDEKKGEDGSVGKGGNKEGDQVEKKDEDGSVEKGGNKERLSEGGKGDNEDGSKLKKAMKEEPVVLPLVRKEGSRGEECDADASNSCKVEKDALIACLRVPGNGMSLLTVIFSLIVNTIVSYIGGENVKTSPFWFILVDWDCLFSFLIALEVMG